MNRYQQAERERERVVSIIVKHPALPPCAVAGRSRNPLYYYYDKAKDIASIQRQLKSHLFSSSLVMSSLTPLLPAIALNLPPLTPPPPSIIFAKHNEHVAVYMELNCAVQVDININMDVMSSFRMVSFSGLSSVNI